jgi:hypothetical protein
VRPLADAQGLQLPGACALTIFSVRSPHVPLPAAAAGHVCVGLGRVGGLHNRTKQRVHLLRCRPVCNPALLTARPGPSPPTVLPSFWTAAEVICTRSR